MRQAKKPINETSIAVNTQISVDRINRAKTVVENLIADPDQDKRLAAGICSPCYYLMSGSVAGRAITIRPCGLCEKDQTYSSTQTDALCLDCAKRNSLCRHCGGDINLLNSGNSRRPDVTS